MKRPIVGRLLALLVAVVLANPATAQGTELWRGWNQPFPPFRVAGNLYYVGANEIGSYLITTDEGHLLIDGGFVETVPIIRENVAALGFGLGQVKILLNTHAHLDHAGGLAELQRLTGARLMIMEHDAPTVASGAATEPVGLRFPAAQVDQLLHDRDQVRLGRTVLTAHLTPGHTPGNTTWSMPVDEGGKRLQVVVVGSPTVLPDTRLTGNPEYPAIAADYRKTFAVLGKLNGDIFLAAHGSFFDLERKARELAAGGSPNPFIDPEGYRRFVARMEKNFRRHLHDEKRAGRSRPD